MSDPVSDPVNDPASDPVFTVPLRWADIDGLGHVSHSAVLTLLEVARDAFLAGHGIGGADYVVRRCEIDYRDEIKAGHDTVSGSCGVESIGTSSLVMRQTLVNGTGATAVEARFVLVLWAGASHSTRPLAEAERASLEANRTE